MAIVTKQWCSWDADQGTVSYSYDDVTHIMQSVSWVNGTPHQEQITLTLEPGQTSALIPAGTVTSIPVAAGLNTPIATGMTVTVAGVSFVASANRAVGATTIAVNSQSIGSGIPAGSIVESSLPLITIPASGQQFTEPAPYSTTVGSTGSVSISSFGIPMQSAVLHGVTFQEPPLDLSCGG